MQSDTPQANRQHLRKGLEAAILFRVRGEINEVIETLPTAVTEEVREGIRKEILPNTQHILGALSYAELQNESALERHVESSVALAKYFVNCVTQCRNGASSEDNRLDHFRPAHLHRL